MHRYTICDGNIHVAGIERYAEISVSTISGYKFWLNKWCENSVDGLCGAILS